MTKGLRLDGKIIRPLVKLGYPVVAGNIGLVVMSLIDNAMVGVLGYVPLAASGISNTIFFVTSVFGMGVLAVYSASIASTLAGRKEKLPGVINSNLLVGLLVSALTFVILHFLLKYFWIFNQVSSVELEAIPYLKILNHSIWPMFIYLAFKNISDGHSRTLPAMFATLTAVLLNVWLNWILIYGHWGFEAYGLQGAGFATLISRWYMALVMIGYILWHPRIKYEWRSLKSKVQKSDLVHMLRLGIPSGLQFFYEVSAFAAAAIMAGWLGAKYLAAHQIAIGLASFTYMVANGVSVASMIKIGETSVGVAKSKLREIGNNSIVLTSIIMLFFAVVFIAFNQRLSYLFTSNTDVVNISATLLIIAAFFQLFDGIQAVSLGLLRGLGDTKIPSRLAMLTYWVIALPTSYYFGFRTAMGMIGIWIGLTVGLMLAAFFLYRRFRQLTFEKI